MSDAFYSWVRRLGEPVEAEESRPRVLVPLEILAGESLPPGTIDLLAPTHVVLLGYYEVPEQTPPDQARMQFEDRTIELLEALTADLERVGATVEPVVAFTRDRAQTIERIATEHHCDGELVVRPIGALKSVLIAVTPGFDPDRVIDVTRRLLGERQPAIVLVDAGMDVDAADVEAAREALIEQGVSASRVSIADPEGTRAVPRMVDAGADVDLIVLAEAPAGLESALLGDAADRVAAGSVSAVLVVRPRPEE